MINFCLFFLSFFHLINDREQNSKLDSNALQIADIIQLYKSNSIKKVNDYLSSRNFKLTNEKNGGTKINDVHYFYYDRNGLNFWISENVNKSYELCYYPKDYSTIEKVIVDLIKLKFDLAHSSHDEKDKVISAYNEYVKDGIFIEVNSFYNKTRKQASYSIIVTGHAYSRN